MVLVNKKKRNKGEKSMIVKFEMALFNPIKIEQKTHRIQEGEERGGIDLLQLF